ncbi:MAG: hypothetical protein FJZ00_12720, partial [Candidatus Sericytochromatia bacterium]|nr:hypothetical protein [Candidatus Tanganyikabacteria bacterium]
DLEAAANELRRALDLDPQNAYAKFNLAWVSRLQQEAAFKTLKAAEAAI